MKRYTNMKDSGVEWIGEIPEHWDISKIKYEKALGRTSFIDGDWIESKDLSNEGIRYLTSGNIGPGYYKEQGSGYISNEKFIELNCTELFPGDLVFSRLFEPVGRCCILPNLNKRVITAVDNVVFRPNNNFVKNYIKYLYSTKKYFEVTSLLARGTTLKRISRSLLGDINILIPPKQEQVAIVAFLDEKTSKIDELVSKKERKIELLKEQRKALINQAVTKGLDPTVPMKDSGVEWIGEIPEGWEIVRMRYLVDIETGSKDTQDQIPDGTYPFFVRSDTVERINSYSYDREAILTAGDGVGVCKVFHHFEGRFQAHQRVYILSRFKDITGKYLFYYTKENFIKEVLRYSAKSTVDSLRRYMFENFPVTLPSIEEQKTIVEFLDTSISEIDELVTKESQKIELLKEYRQSLISEVVTGKIDVRDEVMV